MCNEDIKNKSDKFNEIKFRRNRLKFDGKFIYIWLIAYFIQAILHNYFNIIIGQAEKTIFGVGEFVIFITFIYSVYMEKMIKDSFEDKIIKNKTSYFLLSIQFLLPFEQSINKYHSQLKKYQFR